MRRFLPCSAVTEIVLGQLLNFYKMFGIISEITYLMKKSTCSASAEHSFSPALMGKEPIGIGYGAAEFETTENYPKGHLLCVDRGVYDHVGIADGNGYVYENSYKRHGCGKVSYEEFSGGLPIVDLGILQGSCSPDEMLIRAEKLIRERKKYSLLSNNCEHFVREVCGVDVRSPQVQRMLVSTISTAVACYVKNPALRGLLCGAGVGALSKTNPEQVIKNSLLGASVGLLTGLIISHNNNSLAYDAELIEEANLQKMDSENKKII